MADVPLLAPGVSAAPLSYVIPGAQEILINSAAASFDGTSATVAWAPAITLIAPGGKTVGTYPVQPAVAAGASADVAWFPGVKPPLIGPGSGIPPFGALDDYVFRNSNVTVTGVGFASQANLLIQGNAVTLDGATRVKVEFWAPAVELTASPPNNQAIGFELWDSATNKGTIAYVIGNRKTDGTLLLDSGAPVKSEIILTPSAGAHTFAVYAWKSVAGGTCTVFANTFVDGSGNFAPMFYRLTTT